MAKFQAREWPMNELGKKRLLALMEERELDMKNLSLAAGLGATYVRDILVRGKNGRSRELGRLAATLGVSLDFLMGRESSQGGYKQISHMIEVVGRVGAGIWYEISNADHAPKDSMFPPDTRYPLAAQFDLEVIGTSLNKIAREGDLIRCVKFVEAGLEPQNGDLVIVERTRDSGALVETTAKFYHKVGDRTELRPQSDDPLWQEPLVLRQAESPDDTVRVTALVLYSYRPLSRS